MLQADKMSRILTIILLTNFFTFPVFSEKNPVLHHFTTEDGLFHNEIRLIKKARNGMLWLGTQNGLSSFDGYRFTIYKHNPKDSLSLCSDKIYALETSATGQIWVGTTDGLCSLNPLTSKSTVFKDTFSIQTDFEHGHINTLLEDRSGYLWISTNSGNYRYSIYNNSLEKVLTDIKVDSYYEGGEGIFWVCHDNRVSKFDRNANQFIHTYKSDINKLYTDRFGVLWGVGGRGLYRFMPAEKKFVVLKNVHSAKKSGFNSIAEDKEGNLFLGDYGGGVTIYFPKTGNVSHMIADPNVQYGLSSNDIYDIFSDESGVVWFGTQEGLDFYDWSRQRFFKWKNTPDDSSSLSNNFIQSIYRDKQNDFWLGTRDEGMERMKNESSLRHPQFDHFYSRSDGKWAQGNCIAGMLQDSKNRFWVASWGGGLSMKIEGDKKWNYFKYNRSDPYSLSGNAAITILEDRKGQIWVGTLSGLSLLVEDSTNQYHFKNYYHNADNVKSLSNNSVFKVFEDSKGRIWIALNNGGLNLMHEELDGTIWFQRFMSDSNDPMSISNNEVFVVFEDSKQHIWVGTSAAGFNKIIETKGENGKITYSFKSYTEVDGLSDNEVNAILEDDFGYLWISTNKGLSCFDPQKETFVNYTGYDGVLKGKFRKNAAWKDKDGTMFFGGAAGVNVFTSTHFPKNDIPPLPIITGVFVDGVKYNFDEKIGDLKVLKQDDLGNIVLSIPESVNRFEIQFSAMSFTSPYRNKYAWKLNGVDNHWVYCEGKNPSLAYNSVKSGTYTLEIKAANNDNVWGNKNAKVTVIIKSKGGTVFAIWILMVVALLASFVFAIYKKKSQKNLVEKTIKRSVSDEDQILESRLNAIMIEEKLFLDFKLGLSDLATKLEITTNQLSALLNDVIGKSFYDYINEFRIEEVKKRLIDPQEKKNTILAIAWECGFNSKSAFNRVFKNNTGLTPSQFQKKHTKI